MNICFKEAGSGTNQLIECTAAASAAATWVCKNRGGKCPSAANKTTSSGDVSATATLGSGQNGQVSSCLVLSPPMAPTTFACPGGQTLMLSQISYSDIKLADGKTGLRSLRFHLHFPPLFLRALDRTGI